MWALIAEINTDGHQEVVVMVEVVHYSENIYTPKINWKKKKNPRIKYSAKLKSNWGTYTAVHEVIEVRGQSRGRVCAISQPRLWPITA